MEYSFEQLIYDPLDRYHPGCKMIKRFGKRIYVDAESLVCNHFTVSVNPENNSTITITKNGISKTVKIVDSKPDYQPKVQKTQIKYSGGAMAVFRYVQICVDRFNRNGTNSLGDYYAVCDMLNRAADTMRPVKQ